MDEDREQLEFLMSQALDGQLSAEDAERLERALAKDPEARAEFDRMKRLDAMIGQWGRLTAPADDDQAERTFSARIHEEAEFAISRVLDGDEQAEQELARYAQRDPNLGLLEHQYRRMEMVLRGWGDVEPPVDHDLLYQWLCETIHAEATPRTIRWPQRVIRLYAPMAAAASLLIVAGVWWTGRSGTPAVVQGIPEVQVALVGPPVASPKAEPVVDVSFGIAPDAPIQSFARASDVSGVVISIGGFKGPAGRQSNGAEDVVF